MNTWIASIQKSVPAMPPNLTYLLGSSRPLPRVDVACWTSLPTLLCSHAPQNLCCRPAPDFAESRGHSRPPFPKPFSARSLEAWSTAGTLAVPMPSVGHGTQDYKDGWFWLLCRWRPFVIHSRLFHSPKILCSLCSMFGPRRLLIELGNPVELLGLGRVAIRNRVANN